MICLARLSHALAAADEIVQIVAGRDYDEYATDRLVRAAVERHFTIIGEALRQAWRLHPALDTKIAGLREIIDFRNLLVHGYAEVFDAGVWAIIHDDVPQLAAALRGVLA